MGYGLVAGFYDPSIHFNARDFLLDCGNPPMYFQIQPPIRVASGSLVSIDGQTELSDEIGALHNSKWRESAASPCSAYSFALRNYTYYDARTPSAGIKQQLQNSTCDVASPNYFTPCQFQLKVVMNSMLVTKQTSEHGTNTLRILIDEGSILGAVMFFTWFLSIFVI